MERGSNARSSSEGSAIRVPALTVDPDAVDSAEFDGLLELRAAHRGIDDLLSDATDGQ